MNSALLDWTVIRRKFHKGALLLGNGASCAIAKKFSYQSLFEKAQGKLGSTLAPKDLKLFQEFGTNNFETVLSSLRITIRVLGVLGRETATLKGRHKSIRSALIKSVGRVHPSAPDGSLKGSLATVCSELRKYRRVYTTNYDLLVYWAMAEDFKSFTDWFRHSDFSVDDATDLEGRTTVVFLHGALHLFVDENGTAHKHKWNSLRGLLVQFHQSWRSSGMPLFVSEGSSEEKLAFIGRFDYLSEARRALLKEDRTLVVFGHSMSVQDRHIAKGIRASKITRVAVALRPGSDQPSKRAHYRSLLSGKRVCFFDATTHPIGKLNPV